MVSQLERLISILIKEKGNDLYRYKGVLAVAGKEEKFVFQGVHMVSGRWMAAQFADRAADE